MSSRLPSPSTSSPTSDIIPGCAYIVSIGRVCDVRAALNIPDCHPDDSIVLKYGFTAGLIHHVLDELAVVSEQINGSCFRLKYLCYIDPAALCKFEEHIRGDMDAIGIRFASDNVDDLVIVRANHVNVLGMHYNIVAQSNAWQWHYEPSAADSDQ